MRYARFEELPVWQAAIQLAAEVYRFTESPHVRSSLKNQLERAALSISNNIAEGFERGTTQEMLTFIYIARASAGEVRSMFGLMEIMRGCEDLKSEIFNLKSKVESISRQLYKWAESLQNTKIKGQRYLTDELRKQLAQEKKAKLFGARSMRSLNKRVSNANGRESLNNSLIGYRSSLFEIFIEQALKHSLLSMRFALQMVVDY